MTVVSSNLNQLSAQINTFLANPAIPTNEKGRVTDMRRELDELVKEYQTKVESVNKDYDSRLKSKGDQIQQTIDEITRRLT